MKRKNISAQLVNIKEPQEKIFNKNFWKNLTLDEKWKAAWEMVLDYLKFRGKNGNKSGLQRSIQTIRQRKS